MSLRTVCIKGTREDRFERADPAICISKVSKGVNLYETDEVILLYVFVDIHSAVPRFLRIEYPKCQGNTSIRIWEH